MTEHMAGALVGRGGTDDGADGADQPRGAPLGTPAVFAASMWTSNGAGRPALEEGQGREAELDAEQMQEEEDEEEEEDYEEKDDEDGEGPAAAQLNGDASVVATHYSSDERAMQMVAAATAATAAAARAVEGGESLGSSQLAGFARGFEVVSAWRP